jgi:hypothetical protein
MKTIAKILTMLLFLLPAPLVAETVPAIDVEELFAKKKALVKDIMQLTDKESAVFWPLYNDYDTMLRTRFNRYKALIRDYMQEHKNLSDKKAEGMTTTLMDIQADDLKNKYAYVKKFRKKLPAKRVFQYFVLEDQIGVGFFAMILGNLPPIE